jgi:hypothetical protein
MPPFAQAYAAKCSTCHTAVPALNAFGRAVQRSAYAALDRNVLKRSLPVWVGVNPSYDSQNTNGLQTGNIAIHAVGAVASDWTYHVQQWLRQNDGPGGLDTAWVAYNNLLARSGHLFVGKVETPAPSPFSQWFDLANFAVAEMTVGEHQYDLDNNRWGGRFAYVHGSFDGEVAWLAGDGDLFGGHNFSSDNDKTLQWKLAWAQSTRPLEVGAYGSFGTFPLTQGGTDPYHSAALYVQRDPKGDWPGILTIYQITFDANPGEGTLDAAGNGATIELYHPFFAGNALLSARKEFTNDGLGTQQQTGNVDLEYHLARFVHLYLETYTAQHSKPGYRYMIWWTTPLKAVK